MKRDNMTDRRINVRSPFQQECFLSNGFGIIRCKAVDVSKDGIGVLINETVPFETGDGMSAFINSMQYHSLAENRWAEKDINKNTTRIGLKLSNGFLF